MRKARPPSRRQRPVLPLDVVDNDAAGPGQQRGNDKPNALAAPCRGKGHDMLRPVMAQILAAVAPKEHTSIAKQRSEEHTSELQSLMRISYACICLKKKKQK